jgi:predicted nucleic acid-binding protein
MTYLLDASPAIAMARAGKMDVLRRAANPSATTPQVRSELLRREDETTPAIVDALDSWLKPRRDSKPGVAFRKIGLGRGEASVIASAGASDVVVLDERAARMLARSLGIRYTGLLGLLIEAAHSGRIAPSEAEETIDALNASGFWLSPGLLAVARRTLREME